MVVFRRLVRLLEMLLRPCWKLPVKLLMAPSGTRHSRIVKLINPYVSRKENFDHVPGESSHNTFAGSICTSVPGVEIILFLEA